MFSHQCRECQNTEGSYKCLCDAGYTNKTANKTFISCEGGSKICRYSSFSIFYAPFISHCLFMCLEATHMNSTTVDIDECANPQFSDKCAENAHCNNTPGNYNCVCNEGYEYDINNMCQGESLLMYAHLHT